MNKIKLNLQLFGGGIYGFNIVKEMIRTNNKITGVKVTITPDDGEIASLYEDEIDDTCDFELEGWTKANDGRGSLYKIYNENTTENVEVEYTLTNARSYIFEGTVTVDEIDDPEYDPVNWENGVIVKAPYVVIDGVEYEVHSATITGNTPNSANNLNKIQTNLKNYIDGKIKSGSNSNGSYIKYADGTMICWGYFGQTFTEGQWGSLWEYSLASTVNFPAEFVGNISINANLVQGQGGGTGAISKINYNNSGIFAMNVIRPTQYSSKLFYVSYIAIGKWK